MHGDLWCGNVLVGDGAVTGVVDWEEAELRGEPLWCLARFALTYALYLDRHTRPGALVAGHPGLRATTWGCGIDYLLDGDGWICDLLRAFLRLGMRRLGVPGDLWRDAVVAGVAEVAARADDDGFAREHVRVLARMAPTAPLGAAVMAVVTRTRARGFPLAGHDTDALLPWRTLAVCTTCAAVAILPLLEPSGPGNIAPVNCVMAALSMAATSPPRPPSAPSYAFRTCCPSA